MEFYENGGGATAKLSWSSASQPKQIIPQSRLYPPGSSGQVAFEWLVADQLGTPRIILDKTGNLATTRRHDYLPFGEELYAGVGGRTTALGYSGDTIRQQFTGYERDVETGLDYAQARYCSSSQGRFTSPDPLLASGKATDPQSWNRYAYVGNNPMVFSDPTGMQRGPGRFYGNNPEISHAQGVAAGEVAAAESYYEDRLAGYYDYIVVESEPIDGALEQAQTQKQQEPEDVIKVNTNEANILDFKMNPTTTKDKYGKEGVPIGGEFEIYYKYYIPQPTDGTKPEDYGKITPIIPETGGSPRGTFTDTNFVELKNTQVKVNALQEGVTVEKTERYTVKKDPFVVWGGTYQINYRIAVTNPKTGKVVDRSSIEKPKGLRSPKIPQPVPILVVPKGK